MDGVKITRKDTTKGPPLRILSLDGGGVRGYSMLIILQELMHRTFVEMEGRAPRRHEIPKPCDHFDLIIGTGTGGLIALMLGRLRLSIETCKDVYVRMTKRVFETDKTIAGIPYRSTLFKASKLEEAIKECVREHTVYEDEGNDEGNGPSSPTMPMTPGSAYGQHGSRMNRSMSVASRYSQIGASGSVADFRGPVGPPRWGNPNALLYDNREQRTKTAVTAIYKGSKKGQAPALLRSYDSRKETAAEEKCTIWQAGRASAATALAFKPIQVGQSNFLDEGNGKYNPAPIALDEALINEWPGREIGVFLSIGTGKRPSNTGSQHLWWESFVSSSIGDFAEARRRLIAKIEGCEETHQEMITGRLAERGVNLENYYRLNVEVGVGEFGMNEWNRLAEISTNTRMYLGQAGVQMMNVNAATKLARIWKHNIRWAKAMDQGEKIETKYPRNSWEYESSVNGEPELPPDAVELPGDDPSMQQIHSHMSGNTLRPPSSPQLRPSHSRASGRRTSDEDKFIVHHMEPDEYEGRISSEMGPRRSYEAPIISVTPPQIQSAYAVPPQAPTTQPIDPSKPPPLPPKTPLNAPAQPVQSGRPLTYPSAISSSPPRTPTRYPQTGTPPRAPSARPPTMPSTMPPSVGAVAGYGNGGAGYGNGPGGASTYSLSSGNSNGMQATLTRPPAGVMLPYPADDGPPLVVNMARKPEFARGPPGAATGLSSNGAAATASASAAVESSSSGVMRS